MYYMYCMECMYYMYYMYCMYYIYCMYYMCCMECRKICFVISFARQSMEAEAQSGMCNSCRALGAAPGIMAQMVKEQAMEEKRWVEAGAACVRCHSGGMMNAVLCTQSLECPALFARFEAPRNLKLLEANIKRMEEEEEEV